MVSILGAVGGTCTARARAGKGSSGCSGEALGGMQGDQSRRLPQSSREELVPVAWTRRAAAEAKRDRRFQTDLAGFINRTW